MNHSEWNRERERQKLCLEPKLFEKNPKATGWKVTLPVGSWTLLSQAARLALILGPHHFHHLWQKNKKILMAFGDLRGICVSGPLWSVPLTPIPSMQRRPGRLREEWGRGHQAGPKQKKNVEGGARPPGRASCEIPSFIKYRKVEWKNNIPSLLEFQSQKPALISKNSCVMRCVTFLPSLFL